MDGTKNKKANVDILAKIELQTRKINRIISDLGDVAKIETGQLVIRKTDNNTKEFLKTTVEQMRAMYPDRRVMFKAGVLPHAVFDKDRIEQVRENLITNAVKYSKGKAGVRVSAQAKRKELVFSVEGQRCGDSERRTGTDFQQILPGRYENSCLRESVWVCSSANRLSTCTGVKYGRKARSAKVLPFSSACR
jgi:K+-sensing histidine kinase KdpD